MTTAELKEDKSDQHDAAATAARARADAITAAADASGQSIAETVQSTGQSSVNDVQSASDAAAEKAGATRGAGGQFGMNAGGFVSKRSKKNKKKK